MIQNSCNRPTPRADEPKRAFPRRLAALLATLLLSAAGAIRAQPETPAVEFITPRHLATVLGSSRIEVRPDLPTGTTVERIELLVDGKQLAVLTGSPWETAWDAGDGSEGHTLQALVYADGALRARAVILTSPLRVNQVESVDLVNLYLVVRNRGGEYITDLAREDFKILENGRRQEIDRFSTAHKPLNVGIVLDTSRTMSRNNRLEKAKRAALNFLEILDFEHDEGLVTTFSDEVTVAQEITTDKALLADAIRSAESVGGTALYDAIWKTSKKLEDFDGRRVMVLLSDGRDEDRTGLQPGSLHTLSEALDQALRSEVMIFAIGLGRNLDRECADEWNRTYLNAPGCGGMTVAQVLGRLADSTGGRALASPSATRLRRAFDEVAKDLRHQYSVAYVSGDPVRDGQWREIRVFVPGREFEVITRKGYFATPRRKLRTVPVRP